MENPDVLLELERNDLGLVTKLAFRMLNPGEDRINIVMASELISCMFESEGPESLRVFLDAHIDVLPPV